MRNVSKMIVEAYERIDFWKKNLFMLPTGGVAKLYISEITDFMNSWTNNYSRKHFAFKAINVIPSLIL